MNTSAVAVSPAQGTELKSPRSALGLLAFAQLIIALDYNIVFVALPAISESLTFTSGGLQWVISAYAVVFGGFLLFGGRLSDLLGRRRMFLAGLAVYGGASLFGGLATAPWMLIVARGGQGIGGAILAPATLSLVTTLFVGERVRNRALGVWAAAGSTGMILGSMLGGLLTSALGWQAVFFVNVPLVAVGIIAALAWLPRDAAGATRVRLDFAGAATSTVAILALVFALVQGPQAGWADPRTLIALAAGVLLLAAFLFIERLVRVPLVPVPLFADRGLRLGTVTTFMFMASFGAIPYFVTLYLQHTLSLSPFATGLVFVLPSACVLVGTMVGGKLGSVHSGRRILVCAWGLAACATAALVAVTLQHGYMLVAALLFAVLSLAQGVIFTVMFAVSTATIESSDQGVASGIAQSGQQIGGAVGLGVLIGAAAALTGLRAGGVVFEMTTAGMLGVVALMMLGTASPLMLRAQRS